MRYQIKIISKILFDQEISTLKKLSLWNSAYFILSHALAYHEVNICKHFYPSVDAERHYYETGVITKQYYYKSVNVNSSCIGESPGKLDECQFNGKLSYDDLCNPCEVKEFKEQCADACKKTTESPFGPYVLK